MLRKVISSSCVNVRSVASREAGVNMCSVASPDEDDVAQALRIIVSDAASACAEMVARTNHVKRE